MPWWDDVLVGSSDNPEAPVPTDDPGEYLDPWDAAEAERPGVRLVDGRPYYSAAWLDDGRKAAA